jgi:hypothetical protein
MHPALLRWRPAVALFALLLAACGSTPAKPAGHDDAAAPAPSHTRIGHVFVVVLENEDYLNSFGEESPAPYLARELPAQGALLVNYYGTAHNSLGNYIALISGQGPTPEMQQDCHRYEDFVGAAPASPDRQAVGRGCVFPVGTASLPDQLERAGLSWRGYMEDLGNDPQRERASCGHPVLGAHDPTRRATAGDAYATKHNPFVYFHDIIDDPARCARGVVNLQELAADLAHADTTPNFAFITPGLCHDGHDSPCVSGEPGGLVSADRFLRQWVPQILASAAFRQDGLLIITFDESSGPQTDASACCGEGAGANVRRPGIIGSGGGRVGAVLLSPLIRPGTVSLRPYNHYSLLRSVEDGFGLPYLGYAGAPGQASFGADVYTQQLPLLPPRS